MHALTPLAKVRALVMLARIAVESRLRLRSRYWCWRDETAFGHGQWPIDAKARREALLEYGDWVRRMRGLMRS